MKTVHRGKALFGMAALMGIMFVAPAAAQTTSTGSGQAYPAKPIRIIIPFPIGGIADVFARVIGGKLNEAWGQPVVVENRAGAGGNIAAEYVAKSPPDGYTLVVGSIGTHAVNVSLFKKSPSIRCAISRRYR